MSKRTLIIAGTVLVLLIVGWYALSGSSAPAPALTTTAAGGTGSTNASDRNLVSTLLALRAVKLDATILSNPAFLTLKDFSTQIISEPAGRPDPFAPLQTAASESATSTHDAQIFTPRR